MVVFVLYLLTAEKFGCKSSILKSWELYEVFMTLGVTGLHSVPLILPPHPQMIDMIA